MKCKVAGVVFLGLCAVQAARADLTLRYTFTFHFGSFLPPQTVDAFKRQMAGRMAEGTTVQIKGDRVYTSMGQMFSLTDYAQGEITLVDPTTRRFATVPLAEYPAHRAATDEIGREHV